MFNSDLPVGLAVLDRELRYVRINHMLAQFNGVDMEQALGRCVADVLPRAYPTLEPLLRAVLDRGEPQVDFKVFIEVPQQPGEPSEWEASYLPILEADGAVSGVLVKAVNISAQQRVSKALRGSEARFRSVFEASPDGMAVVQEPGRFVLVNPSLCKMFGHPPEALLDREVDVLLHDGEQVLHLERMKGYFANPSLRRMAPKRQVLGRHAQGHSINLEIALTPLADTQPVQVLITVMDISQRLRVQQQIEEALNAKTVLLNEVHHRVKNNLQIIASLLRLQSNNVDESARAVLRDSRSRVKAMALTHQLLYEMDDFASMHLGLYLERLIELVKQAYTDQSELIGIHVNAADKALRIDVQQAVACALLVHELVTNSLKHAFPNRRPGGVWIDANRHEDGHIRIVIRDDGIGLPTDVHLGRRESLGFQLMPMLAEQIGARLELLESPAGGTAFLIDIPEGDPS
ncbi:MAG: PAS domain S-box protein [Burkholderiaceae bacterium]|nr:PAS domain S-box protein [Burkholderiaceae bacterium]